jgi:DNA-binding MarR family transcriptional regulator
MPSAPPPPVRPAADHDALDRDALVRELSLHAMTALRAAQQEAQRAFEPLGLRPSHVVVLEMIHRGIDQPKLLAAHLETVQSAVTAVLNELQTRDLITRATDPEDRRRVRLRVTDHGLATLARVGEAWLAATERWLADADVDDLRATARVVRVLTRTVAA